jgi:hypothetical protein
MGRMVVLKAGGNVQSTPPGEIQPPALVQVPLVWSGSNWLAAVARRHASFRHLLQWRRPLVRSSHPLEARTHHSSTFWAMSLQASPSSARLFAYPLSLGCGVPQQTLRDHGGCSQSSSRPHLPCRHTITIAYLPHKVPQAGSQWELPVGCASKRPSMVVGYLHTYNPGGTL